LSHIRSGIWFDQRLYSATIPETDQQWVARLLPREIEAFERPREDFIVPLAGVPHRVFYRLLNPSSPLPPAYRIGLYSLAGVRQTLADLRWRILGSGGAALLGALALSLLLSHGLSVPIQQLVPAQSKSNGATSMPKFPCALVMNSANWPPRSTK